MSVSNHHVQHSGSGVQNIKIPCTQRHPTLGTRNVEVVEFQCGWDLHEFYLIPRVLRWLFVMYNNIFILSGIPFLLDLNRNPKE